MDLIIVRHGESEAFNKRVVEGRADFALTEKGLRQAELLAGWLKARYRVSRIYTSPLQRAKETAAVIAQALALPITEDSDLMEFNNGLLAGTPLSQVAEKFPVIPNIPAHGSVYLQETRIQYRMRGENVMSRVFYENQGTDQVLLVTHGGMINQLFRSFFKLPVDCQAFVASRDGCIHQWAAHGESRGVILTDFVEHLAGL